MMRRIPMRPEERDDEEFIRLVSGFYEEPLPEEQFGTIGTVVNGDELSLAEWIAHLRAGTKDLYPINSFPTNKQADEWLNDAHNRGHDEAVLLLRRFLPSNSQT